MRLDGQEDNVPVALRSFALTPLDLLLTVDFLLVIFGLMVGLNVAFGGRHFAFPLGASGLAVLGFAGWLGKRHKVPPPQPSDNPLRRGLGVLLLGVGGTLTLAGALIAVVTVGVFLTDKKSDVPFFAVPLSFLPLLIGHAIMYGGAKVRSAPPAESR